MHLQRLDTLEWEAEAFKPAGLVSNDILEDIEYTDEYRNKV